MAEDIKCRAHGTSQEELSLSSNPISGSKARPPAAIATSAARKPTRRKNNASVTRGSTTDHECGVTVSVDTVFSAVCLQHGLLTMRDIVLCFECTVALE